MRRVQDTFDDQPKFPESLHCPLTKLNDQSIKPVVAKDNESTESDCLKYCVFGGKKSDINNFQSYIKPFETLLFLWNRSTETYVDGVFLAISRLELSICKQVSWHERYTAQVQVQNVRK